MSRFRRTALALVCGLTSVAGLASQPAGAATALPTCRAAQEFEAHDFPTRPRGSNPWLPLRPGWRTVLSGTVIGDDGRKHPHAIVSEVSSVTKLLDGVQTRVVFDRDYEDGVLQESELAFAAQSTNGSVWTLGEYPEEWSGGRLDGAPATWIAGLRGSVPGVAMPAHPRMRTPAYSQGRARSVGFDDCAQVVRTGQHIRTTAGSFENVLVTKEWAPNDPEGGYQLKYSAAGFGTVRTGALGDPTAEVLQLTIAEEMTPAQLHRVNAQVLAQDRRGYRVSPQVYGRTPPARCHDGDR